MMEIPTDRITRVWSAISAFTRNIQSHMPMLRLWFWLIHPGVVGGLIARLIALNAYAPERALFSGLVLLDGLPGLLDALGKP